MGQFVKIVGHSSGTTSRKSQAINGHQKTFVDKRQNHKKELAYQSGTRKFIAVDGEGITLENGEHRYVLLGIGNEQIEDENGLEWPDILTFLYNHYERGIAFVGFYLGYDFDRWLCTMPRNKVERLVTSEGRESRKSKSPNLHNRVLPVDLGQWQINMLGKKMFEFRKRACHCDILYCKCSGKEPWMRICDAGAFFQTSFLKAIDPRKWKNPIVSNDEYELIKKGKENRAYADHINDEMRFYNKLENEILARLMNVLNKGFKEMGISLSPRQWFGPGQAAQEWMKIECMPRKEEIRNAVPAWFLDAARMSYFGGWFEIMMHGIVPGESHEYDINSAYPYIISSLPCLLHGNYAKGNGKPIRDTGYVLVYAAVSNYKDGVSSPIGTMLHRQSDSTIFRPTMTKGWFWLNELNAAKKAKLIRRCHIYEWMSYDPCDCLPPMRNVSGLYDLRIKNGKDTPLGKACRLAYNSMYGKLAQSIGEPIFSNPVWASLITSGCRAMILDAIGTHPKGAKDVCMVATDAVFFATPHPTIPISNRLGEWGYERRDNLTLFKPGVYWDDNARRDINAKRTPKFKARGVAASDFANSIAEIDRLFAEWNTMANKNTSFHDMDLRWPIVEFQMGFAMTSCLQAIRRNKWELAGHVDQSKKVVQTSNPMGKRVPVMWPEYLDDGRYVWRTEPWDLNVHELESKPYMKLFGMYDLNDDPGSLDRIEQWGITPEGTIGDVIKDNLGMQ